VRVVVDINHPAHVHYFKNFVREMGRRGHEVLITASNKELTYTLLDGCGMEYIKLGTYGKSLLRKMLDIPMLDIAQYRAVRSFNPDIFLGFGSLRAAHVSWLLRKPFISFEDTEHCTAQLVLYLPFAHAVCTPTSFQRNLGKRQVRFNGYMELAALHPNYFTPDPSILDLIGLREGDPYIVLRFVSWDASHDVGQAGIGDKLRMVKELESYGKVIITSESPLGKDLDPYAMKIPPERLHDLLYYATLYIGEGATTASECAVLGTHAIYVNTLRCGVQEDEEKRYGLVYNFSGKGTMEKEALAKAVELLKDPSLRAEGKRKRERLLSEKIDVTAFMVQFIENWHENSSNGRICRSEAAAGE
jgi:uncharacterized protein